MQFKVEYGYENLGENAEFTPYERHIIWRYKNLKDYLISQSREDKQIIEQLNGVKYRFGKATMYDSYNKKAYIELIEE